MTVETVDLTKAIPMLDAQPDLGGSISFVGTTGLGPSTGAHATENFAGAGITPATADLQLSFATVRESGRMQVPVGYTQIFTPFFVSTQGFYGYYKFLSGGETGGLTFQGTDAAGTPIETADYTTQSVIYRGVDQTKPFETTPEAFGSSSVQHWGRAAQTSDTTTVDNCLNIWVFMHSSASRTFGADGIWTAELVERVTRTNGLGPEIKIAEKPIYKAGAVGGHHLNAGGASNAAMIQFCLRPATP